MNMSYARNAPVRASYSDTLAGVPYYSVRAVSDDNAVLTFGLQAEDFHRAKLAALDRLPWPPKDFSVEVIIPPEQRDGQE